MANRLEPLIQFCANENGNFFHLKFINIDEKITNRNKDDSQNNTLLLVWLKTKK
jgi:hypothetical protein